MKKFIILVLAAAVSVASSAQLLWKVTSPTTGQTSYLFGTHHVAPVSTIDKVKGFREAMDKVSKVYGEVEMSSMTSPEFQSKAMMYCMAPADSMLTSVLTPGQIADLDAFLSKAGIPVTTAQMAMMKPAAVSNLVTMALAQEAFPEYDATQQLDATVQNLAKEMGKEVEGLETPDFQLQLLFGAPISEQVKDLMKVIENPAKTIEASRMLAEAYAAEDMVKILELLEDPDSGLDAERMDDMLNDRNRAWAEFLTGMIPAVSVLVAVGAGHLPGKDGLVSLLRQKGFNVEPVE